MNRKTIKGVAIVEFSLVMLILVPLLIGTMAVGLNLLRSLATIQLARDTGHMYARGTDFSQTGNQTVLTTIGTNVGLTTSSSTSTAVIILSSITYVDKSLCASAGKVDGGGNPSGCTNYTKWVFTQRINIGKTSIRSSAFGAPGATVTLATNGTISLNDQTTNTQDVATIPANTINPYANTSGVISGLPSGQVIYISEVASTGFALPPFVPSAVCDAYNMF